MSPRGIWLSLDGVEGAGKTTLAQAFESALVAPKLRIDEFSDSPVGDYLREGVKNDPHVFAKSRLGQSLLFLGDFFERHANVTEPALLAGKVVVQDRGFLSKYAYQYQVLREALAEAVVEDLLQGIFRLATPPDVTVLLTASSNVIHKRLSERGESVDADQTAFIVAAQEILRSRTIDAGQVLEFDTGTLLPAEIVSEVLRAVPQLNHS